MNDILDKLNKQGFYPDEIPEESFTYHRFKNIDDEHNKNCSIIKFDDGAIYCKSFKNGNSCYVKGDNSVKKSAIQIRVDRIKRKMEVENKHKKIAAVAQEIIKRSKPVSMHEYLINKGVFGVGAYQYNNDLVLPLYDKDGVIYSIQRIYKDKYNKWYKIFLKDARTKGCMIPLVRNNNNNNNTILVCEGYATGMSLYLNSEYDVYCAMNCHNLVNVVNELKVKFQYQKRIIIIADNDENLSGEKGAIDTGCEYYVIPNTIQEKRQYKSKQPKIYTGKITDANDYYLAGGDLRLWIKKTIK